MDGSVSSFSDQVSGISNDGISDSGDGSCSTIASEMKGPYPLDGSNGTNARPYIYRSNMIGGDIPSTSGVVLNINLNLQNTNDSCSAVSNASVYLWHCD